MEASGGGCVPIKFYLFKKKSGKVNLAMGYRFFTPSLGYLPDVSVRIL